MKWLVLVLQDLGVYLVYKGIGLFLFEGRGVGVGIYQFGYLIPATDKGLYTFGTSFILIGILLALLPLLFKKVNFGSTPRSMKILGYSFACALILRGVFGVISDFIY